MDEDRSRNEDKEGSWDRASMHILATIEDFNRRIEKLEDRQGATNIKLALIIGGCILASAFIPVLVVFIERMTFPAK